MTSLRARRHAETRQAIFDAAFALFERHGFSDTAMEQIAEHAGVSRSTLYRRYANKEDIVLEVPRQWLAAWDETVAAQDPDASLAETMAAGCLAVANVIDSSQTLVLSAYRALAESPNLQASGATNQDWLDRIVDLITDHTSELDHEAAAIIAGAYMGAIDTMMQQWAMAGGKSSVVDATGRVIARLAPILP